MNTTETLMQLYYARMSVTKIDNISIQALYLTLREVRATDPKYLYHACIVACIVSAADFNDRANQNADCKFPVASLGGPHRGGDTLMKIAIFFVAEFTIKLDTIT